MAKNPGTPDAPIQPSVFEPIQADAPKAGKPGKPGRYLLLLGVAVFALVMLFLSSARSLQIVVQSETPHSVSVSGLVVPLGGRYLLREGEYTISASAEGYHPLSAAVTVDDREDQRVELVMQPLPGLLSIDSQPPGASVSIDGSMLGRTPLKGVEVTAGAHQLLLQEERHLPLQQVIEINGRNIAQQLSLELAPAWATLSVASQPPGASILVDGEPVAKTPATVEILQGEHQLLLQLPSYADWHKTLKVNAGSTLKLPLVELQPAPGMLELSSVPSGANVTLDGEFQGQTPLSIALAPGSAHRLAIFKPGYARVNESVQLAASTTEKKTVTLTAQLGDVSFRISPANAELLIDGQSQGPGSQTIALPAVEQSVEVRLAGYASVKRRVTPRPGLAQQLEITLQTQHAAKAALTPAKITTALGQSLVLLDPANSPLSDFSMGASRREPGRRANEVLHPVGLRRTFYLQTTEVTNAQFRQFQKSHDSGQVAGNSLNRDHQPAVQVSWQQAASFCNWLSEREGLTPFYLEKQGIITGYNPAAIGYRLPSETEWAWAARAKGETLLKFPWGDTFPPTAAVENYADNSSAAVTGRTLDGYTDGHVASADVAAFGPNQHGLYDMGGNAAEWVHDVYAIPSANSAPVVDGLGSQSGDNYVIRGASWGHSKLSELRLSYRDYGQAGRDDVGFRLARYAE